MAPFEILNFEAAVGAADVGLGGKEAASDHQPYAAHVLSLHSTPWGSATLERRRRQRSEQ
jgi:hypothetical protein